MPVDVGHEGSVEWEPLVGEDGPARRRDARAHEAAPACAHAGTRAQRQVVQVAEYAQQHCNDTVDCVRTTGIQAEWLGVPITII